MTAPSPAGISMDTVSGIPTVTLTTSPQSFGTGDKLAAAILGAVEEKSPGSVHPQAKK